MRIDGGVYAEMKKHLPSRIHFQRIETGITGGGIPDINYCCDGIEGWIEAKKTSGWKVKIRPEQCGWALRRHRAGGRTFFAVRRITTSDDQLYLIRGRDARELLDLGLRPFFPTDLVGESGPANWDWPEVLRRLLGPQN